MASGGAEAHCSPGARHAWPKVSAPTARAPARWRRSTAGVDASLLNQLKRFEEAKSLILKIMPAARRALGENKETTLRLRWSYAQSLCCDANATLDDLREAVRRSRRQNGPRGA